MQPVLGNVFTPALVEIDVDNVPVVEIKQEAKVKKPKAQAQAQNAVVSDKADKAAEQGKETAEKVTEAVKGAAAAVLPTEVAKAVGVVDEPAAGAEGQQPKKVKKEKKEKEKKAPAPPPVVEAPAPWQIDLRVGKIVDGGSPGRGRSSKVH